MDEPAAGLDPNATADMYALIKMLNDSGITIIMISHDIAAAVENASHILHLGEQSVLFFGTVSDYLKSDTGSIYTRKVVLSKNG
jgi:zinc transport system ATP-binding protein